MEELIKLCNAYKNHLGDIPFRGKYTDRLGQEKVKIINSLLTSTTPKRTLFLLSDPRGPVYKTTLQKNRSSWTWTFIAGFLTAITFPISLPVLIAWSWIMRGTPNFLKPDGAILVDKLLMLSKAALGRSSGDEHINARPAPHHPRLRTPSVDNQLTRKTQHGSSRTESLISRETFGPHSSSALSLPASIQDAPNLYAALFDLEKDYLKDTGKPRFLASRIRPFCYTTDEHFLVNGYCEFRYSHQAPQAVTIAVLTNLDPVLPHFEEDDKAPQQTEQPTHEGMVEALSRRVSSFFFFTPTFEYMFNQAKAVRSLYNPTECEFYEKALDLATNNKQRILAIEGIINHLDRQYKSHNEDYLRLSSARPDENPKYEAQRLRGVERYQKQMADALAMIEVRHNQLPANYRTMTPSANHMQESINLVFQLLSKNKIGEARLHYLRIPNFSAFLKLAFPYLQAMKHQLRAIFCLLDTKGYFVSSHGNTEPCDHELRQHLLEIHLNDGSIWCAVLTGDTVDRFIIKDSELGREADAIRVCLDARGVLSEEQKNFILDAVANRGYYKYNNPLPAAALLCFQDAHALVQQYYPALAERLQTMTLAPLQALMRAGEIAKQNTPLSVQRESLKLESAEIARQLANREIYIPEKQFNDTEWDALLITGDATPSHRPV